MSNIGIVFTAALLAAAVWLMATRFRLALDSNWPLIFYAGVVLFQNRFAGSMNAYAVYVAVMCALLLRFEFLNERLITLVRLIETICLLYLSWSLFHILWKELR